MGSLLNSIGNRAILFVFILISIITGAMTGYNIYRLSEMSHQNARETYAAELAASKDKIRNYTSLPYAVIEQFAAYTAIPEAERKARALEMIKEMRLPDGNYFWINNTDLPAPLMIMHPTSPSLDGKPLNNPAYDVATSMQAGISGKETDTGGHKNLFQAMAEVAVQAGEGFVTYQWPKPKAGGGATSERYPKLSYVKLYKPWGWVIGNGIYIDDLEARVAATKEAFDATVSSIVTDTSIYGAIFVVLALAGLWLYFQKLITSPLGRVERYAQTVANGDLDARAEGGFPCETGQLKLAIETMVEHLKQALSEAEQKGHRAEEESDRAKQALADAEQARKAAELARSQGLTEAADLLEEVVGNLSSASEELNAQVVEVSRGSDMQRDRSAETATAMEEMNASVLEVARNASDAATSAEQARQQAENGRSIVEQVVAAIGEVRGRAEAMRTGLGELGEHAEGIGRIMGVITDIADQTNLLALNAAIEAARAGDAGRGFAVVADEVRKLAEKTMLATKEVGDAINSIQSSSEKNIQEMEQASDAVSQSTSLAGKAGEALQEIVSIVNATTDQVNSIASAAEEQSSASEEISRAIEDISRVSDESANGMHEASLAITELTGLTDQLIDMIARLREN